MYKLNNKTSVSDSYIADYKSIYGSKFSSYSENTKEDVIKKSKKARHYKKNFKLKRENIFSSPKHMSNERIEDKPKSHRAKYVFKFIISCLILMVFLVLFSEAISLFEKNDSIANLRRYDNFIWPIVMQDPCPFDEENFIDETMGVESALWDLCTEHKNEQMRLTDDGRMSFSNQEVNESFRKLFNKSLDFENLKDKKNSFFEFNDYKKVFLVEPVSGVDNYFPHVIKSEKNGSDTILTVEYFLPCDQFSEDMKTEISHKVEKVMIYKLKKDPETKKDYISAVYNP